MDNKTRPYISCEQETHTNWKWRDGKKFIKVETKKQKSGVGILTPDKTDLKSKINKQTEEK